MLINRKLLGCACAGVALVAMGTAQADGNRYDRDRYYHKEISVSEAYLAMEHSKGWNNKANKDQAKPVLIDVRTLREYASGHPEDAYNIPFPNIKTRGDQFADNFYWEVYNMVGGNLDTPIMLLCRTGSRSIAAGNILANPDSDDLTTGLKPFTNVTNIWEGFVGQPHYGFVGGTIKVGTDDEDGIAALVPALDAESDPQPLITGDGKHVLVYPLDLNNDGKINKDSADVYEQTKDANPDKDGWRNFAALPWTTKIRQPLAYQQNPSSYEALELTPVE